MPRSLRSHTRTRAMVWLTSWPYAPTFWIGVAPTEPGMPESASMPTQPRSTASATSSSQLSPAATVTVAPPHDGPSSASISAPVVATSTTVPAKPLSATTRLLPPPSTSTGSPAVSASTRASISCCSVVARTQRSAGPPRRSVVWSRRSGTQDSLGHPEDLLARAGDRERDGREPVVARLRVAGDLDLDAALGGDDDRVGELAAEADDLRAGVPRRDRPGRERHRVHAVGDHAGQADAGRHRLVLVDRVLVAAGGGVADQVRAGDGVGLRVERHASGPRWTTVDDAVHTSAPASSVISLAMPMMSLPPICRRLATVRVAVSTSPGTTGRS